MAGYSQTPLAKKLGMKPGLRIALPGIPKEIARELSNAIADCQRVRSAVADFALLFCSSSVRLHAAPGPWKRRLDPAGAIWLAWPKKSSGVATNLDGNVVRRIGLRSGYVDVKVCAIDDVWSGLRFVVRLRDRPQTRNGA